MKFVRYLFLIIIVCFMCLFSFSQTIPPNKLKEELPQPIKKSDVPIQVKANVLVWDSKGVPANDVKKEDLKIFEDGVEQQITYFTEKKDVLNVGLIMDNTGSVRYALETEIFLGRGIVTNLVRHDEAFLVRFVTTDKIQILQDWTSNQALLKNKISDLFIEGGQSAIIDSVYLSAATILKRAEKDNSERYALILITDGEDRDSFYKETQLYELLKDSNVQIFPIVLTGGLETERLRISPRQRAADFVNRLALKTGGTAFFVNYQLKAQEFNEGLEQIIKSIADELRSQYIIGYTSTNQFLDGNPRKLTVQIADSEKGEKRRAFIRESYMVPKNMMNKQGFLK